MTAADLGAMAPYSVIAAAVAVGLAALAVRRSHAFAASLAFAALAAASALAALEAASPPGRVGTLFTLDRYSLFFSSALFAAAAFVAVFAYGYLRERTDGPEELYLLLLSAALGGSMLAAASNLLSLFLTLEVLSVSMYALVAYVRRAPESLEAGLKYLVLASVSGAALLLGAALVFYATGDMRLPPAPPVPLAGPDALVWQAGMLLLLAGLGFKLALVPFHMWTADVYQGSASPATAFVATVSKGAALAAVYRVFAGAAGEGGAAYVALAVLAAASMLGGNLLALLQTDVKRILGYSSVAHMGYLLLPVLAGGPAGAAASGFYFVAYAITMLAALGVLSVLPGGGELAEASGIEDVRGLFRRNPWLAGVLAFAMLSLAGIPLTAVFVGKVYLVVAGAGAALWGLLATLAAGSVMGIYYYLRVVVALFSRPNEAAAGEARVLPGAAVALAVLAVALVWTGVLPATLARVAAVLGG